MTTKTTPTKKEIIDAMRAAGEARFKNVGSCGNFNDWNAKGDAEFKYSYEVKIRGTTYSWHVSDSHLKGRHLTSSRALWVVGGTIPLNTKFSVGTKLTRAHLNHIVKIIHDDQIRQARKAAVTPKPTMKPKATKKKVSKTMMKQRPKVRDKVKLLGKWGHITEVRKEEVHIKEDGVSGGATHIYTDMLHKVAYRPDPIAKMSFYWLVKFPRRTTKQRPVAKPKPEVATPKLTIAQKKRLATKGHITVKRGGKFVTITR